MLKNIKLKHAILISIFAAIFLPTLFMGVFVTLLESERLKSELDKYMEHTSKNLSFVLSEFVWNMQIDSINELIKNYAKDESILEIKVLGFLKNDIKELASHTNNSTFARYHVYEVNKKIVFFNKEIGELHLKISDDRFYEALEKKLKEFIVLFFIQFLLAAAVMLFIWRYKILVPIKQLLFQTKKISKKELDEPFLWDRNDEIGMLGKSLEATRVSLSELFARLERKNYELEGALLELQNTQNRLFEAQKMASLANLIAGVAHEMNTPVGNIFTALSSLDSKIKSFNKKVDSEKYSKEQFLALLDSVAVGVSVAHTNAERTIKLIETFKKLSFSQKEGGTKNFVVKEFLDDLLFAIQKRYRDEKLQIEVDCEEGLELCTHTEFFGSLFEQLFENSMQHGFVGMEEKRIEISAKSIGEEIIVLYKDNGIGIPDALRDKIFEPFTMGARKGVNIGLGLHIAYNIITQKMRGKIELCSFGDGCCFEMRFPKKIEAYTA